VAARIRVAGGARLRDARATVLTHEDMHAANTLERPDEVGLATLPARLSGDAALLAIPKRAVVGVSLSLA
jgi:alpha-L-arabinofuranosidase